MTSGICPQLDLSDWGAQLLAPLHGGRYPLGGTLELTERCNLACRHCYISQPVGAAMARARELSTERVTALLDAMVSAGTLFLALTGGEPLLRPDFDTVYRAARERGLLVTVMTNGTLLTPEIADLFVELRPRAIEITMYGATEETYERVTQAPGSFARFRRALDLLRERSLPLMLKSVLLTLNRHELAMMRALAREFTATFRYDGLLWPRLDGSTAPLAYQLPVEELLALDRADPEREAGWRRLAGLAGGETVRSEYVYSCGAGLHTYHIDSVGRMSICTMARRPAFDLAKMGFDAAWQRLGAERERKRVLDTPCRTCSVGALCTQCPGWSQAVHGDDEAPVEFVCDLGRQRAAQLERMAT
ncbi:MAG: radical SAM protein [Anaerolineae bacterium]|jgi:radical SAM protein with 4Fe4S-binding SPASM domain